MNYSPHKNRQVRRSARFGLAVLTILLFAISSTSSAAHNMAQAGWSFDIEQGKSARSTLSVTNSCMSGPQTFRVISKVKYLSFEESVDLVLVGPNSTKEIGVRFDAAGLKPKVYRDQVTVQCITCKKDPTCTQDRTVLPIVMTVIKPSTPEKITEPSAMPNAPAATVEGPLHFQSMQATFIKADAEKAIAEFTALVARPRNGGGPMTSGPRPVYIWKVTVTCDNGKTKTFEISGILDIAGGLEMARWTRNNCTSSATVSWKKV